jgi:thiamine biosynthesis lipoprotein
VTALSDDVAFDCMGTRVRLVGGDVAAGRAFLERYDATLSRFRPDSELCRLNAAAGGEAPASPLLRTALAAALWAAARTGGLVDPTLAPALEASGYDRDRRVPELPLAEALLTAPPRRRAAPDPDAAWRNIAVTEHTVRRPPGLRVDTGGTGKGLAADLLVTGVARAVAARHRRRWAVDCGGDLRVCAPPEDPFEVHVQHPLSGETAHVFSMTRGAVATSGLNVRLWCAPDGTPRHHILDPSTRQPAWTGLIQATALAPTALEAEARAKAALLTGPRGAARRLRRYGGLVVHDNGDVELHP